MDRWARRWFLVWGLLIAVAGIRFLLPWRIVWATVPERGPLEAITATFSDGPAVIEAIEQSAPVLLMFGGTFLVFLFFHWLFLEDKHYGLRGERYVRSKGVWFFAVVSILLSVIVWFSLQIDPMNAFGAVLGSTAFFIVHGFRQNAEAQEQALISGRMSDVSKIFYLEVIDASFSIDGVIGAFAFTLSVPLILVGNGLGALAVRQITVGNIERIGRYPYLKNGAMYSILVLGCIMVADGFGFRIPSWLSPIVTFVIVGYFFALSVRSTQDGRSPYRRSCVNLQNVRCMILRFWCMSGSRMHVCLGMAIDENRKQEECPRPDLNRGQPDLQSGALPD
jgi:hypothetical protein